MYLAGTNNITLSYAVPLATYQLSGATNTIELNRNPGNNAGSTTHSSLFLGLTNVFNVDSIGIGRDKSDGSCYGTMGFNPAFIPSSPVAYFYGVTGPGSRVTWWAVGDGNSSSSSSHGGYGLNDFSGGTVYAFVNEMVLGRDAASSSDVWAGPHTGVLTFTNGTVDVNTLIVGDQELETGTSTATCLGTVNMNGGSAVLKVNTLLTLGKSTLNTGAGQNAAGKLNVTNGIVYANNITVGTYTTSVNNSINLNKSTLIVTNTLATNSAGLYLLGVTNSVIGLSVPANGSLRGLVHTLSTAGSTNVIQLNATPVFFSSYPQQFPLVKYTTWAGTNNFGLTNLPAWAVGATLVSNGANASLDLSLPSDPRPIITSQPTPYSGNPGDNVTGNFVVTIAGTSVTPLGYHWYYTNGVSTNLLANGAGPSGSSTLSGATSANLQMANAQPGDNGGYFVVVTNAFGTNTSSLVQLVISASAVAPTAGGPATQTATNGLTTSIFGSSSGSPVPTLYWQFNGAPLVNGTGPSGSSTISGSTTATLNIANPQYPGDQGTYSLIASNSAGLATNNTVLTVIVPPAITSQPVSLIVTNTQAASFTIGATGVPAPTYQWSKNGTPISSIVNSSATTATFTIASTSASDSANYSVTISNPAGATNSATVSLTVNSIALTVAGLSPANGQTNVCYDTPLYLNFSQTPTLRTAGKIRIYNVTNAATPVDTIDLSLSSTVNATYAANIQPYNFSGDTITNFPVIITGTQAAIYPHHDLLTSNQTYYVTVDAGTFADGTGAYFAGITATNVWKFTTKPTGPVNSTNLVVAADGSGDFLTVQGAVDSVPVNNTTPTIINIRNGFYTEEVDIKSKNNLDFRGQSRNGTLIGYPNDNWVNGNGAPWRAMFIVNGNDCSFENLTITNTTPAGGSQAEALDTEGTRTILYNMELDSYQDTFLSHSAGKLIYFQDSLIQGQTDFNWGYGSVYYTNCELRCLLSGGHVTQPRSPATTNGFGFINCRITQGYSGSAAYDLGRTIGTPSSPSEVLFYNCLMADVITGYANDAGVNMADYGDSNLTATATKTLTFSTHSPSNDPFVIAIQSASTWLYGWSPQVAPNLISQPGNQSASHGQAASFSVSATGIPAPTYQWLQNGSPLAGATSATFAIASAVRTNGGNYSVVVSNGSGSVTSSVATLTYNNTAPVANSASYVIPAGYPYKIALSDLSANWSDVDGDVLALTSTISSTNGATVSYDTSYVYYNNPNGVNDQINYTVGDGQGGTAAGLINLTVSSNPVAGTPQTITVTGSSATLNLAGIPTYQYEIQRSTNLVDWVTIETTNAPSNGLFQFIDTFTDLGGIPPATAYYRTAQP